MPPNIFKPTPVTVAVVLGLAPGLASAIAIDFEIPQADQVGSYVETEYSPATLRPYYSNALIQHSAELSNDGGHGSPSAATSFDNYTGSGRARAEMTQGFATPILKAEARADGFEVSHPDVGTRTANPNNYSRAAAAQHYTYTGEATTLALDVRLDGELYTPVGSFQSSNVSAYVGLFDTAGFQFFTNYTRYRPASEAVRRNGTQLQSLSHGLQTFYSVEDTADVELPRGARRYLYTTPDGRRWFQDDDYELFSAVIDPDAPDGYRRAAYDRNPISPDRKAYQAWRAGTPSVVPPSETEFHFDDNGIFDETRTIYVDVDPNQEFYIYGELVAEAVSWQGESGFANAFNTLTTSVRRVDGGSLEGFLVPTISAAVAPPAVGVSVPEPATLVVLLPALGFVAARRARRTSASA